MEEQSNSERTVNQVLGTQPSLGPFPASQIVPWGLILVFSWFCKGLIKGSWLWTVLLATWLMATWWILTGDRAWRFLSKFRVVPLVVRGCVLSQALLMESHETKARQEKARE